MSRREPAAAPGPYRTGYVRRNGVLHRVPYRAVRGQALYQGDIVLGTVRTMEAVRRQVEEGALGASITLRESLLWPGGIAFVIKALPNPQRVRDAIAHVEELTTLRFRPRTSEKNYLIFRQAGDCRSAVGMQGGPQLVDVGPFCTAGHIVHEICHAAGMWHTHGRQDREKHIRIRPENILPGRAGEFGLSPGAKDFGPYDFASIMHYGPTDFSVHPSRKTIELVVPDPANEAAMGQRTRLSDNDVAALHHLYG